jgi:hypothetical protein
VTTCKRVRIYHNAPDEAAIARFCQGFDLKLNARALSFYPV